MPADNTAAARSIGSALAAIVPDLRGRALRLTSGDAALADDVVQDTVERALRFAGQYQTGTNLRAWALQILFSVFVTRYRRHRRDRNAMRVLMSDPCAWTTPESFSSPDREVTLTPSVQAELDALPLLARGSAMRFLLTRLYDWQNRQPGALVQPKNPIEYVKRLRFHRGIASPAGYGLDA